MITGVKDFLVLYLQLLKSNSVNIILRRFITYGHKSFALQINDKNVLSICCKNISKYNTTT